ncbi:hypothetical protein HEMROJRC1_20480 [Rodentibacter sp. JRC1]|uniref:DUF1456 family protein n=1 Tax=Rodentibacter sp. JRC1 TaxID=2874504 RepID=UPI001CFC5CE7|nr:DUF1456 family protein [Rodentibacter sp. JRC1]GJI56936.1 hypothetical protein HEMROJRC1_20480 [Rodentibacter sp. JRC1]
MDKNTIFAKLFRLTPFSYDIPSFIELMAKSGYSVTKSQINCWQRKEGSEKSRPVPDFVFEVIFNYLFDQKTKGMEIIHNFEAKKEISNK